MNKKTMSSGSINPQLNSVNTGKNSTQEIQKKPKKEPSALLNLFTAIKTKPTLEERVAMAQAQKEQHQLQEKQEHEKCAQEELAQQQLNAMQNDVRALIQKQTAKCNKVNKGNFKSLKMADGSVYYGQVLHYMPKSKVEDLTEQVAGFQAQPVGDNLIVSHMSQVDEAHKPHVVMARHGYGIQIYAEKQGRYCGDWQMDKKTGDGHQVYTDGSEYRGSLVDGVKNGHGLYIWTKDASQSEHGHVYLGCWKNDMMHGPGRFQHRDQRVSNSNFCNNLHENAAGFFVNPFLSVDQDSDYVSRVHRKDSDLVKEETLKNQKVSVYRVSNRQQYLETL